MTRLANAQAEGHDFEAIVRARIKALFAAVALHDRVADHRWARGEGDRCAVCRLSLARLTAEVTR